MEIPRLKGFAHNIVCWCYHRCVEHGKRDIKVVDFGEQGDYDKGEKEIYKPVLFTRRNLVTTCVLSAHHTP